MEKEWRIDESLSPKLITMKRKFVRQTVLYNKISCLSVTIACSIYLLNPLVMVFVNKIFLHRDVPYTVALGLSTPFNYDDNFFIYITLFIVEFRLALIVAYELQCSQYFITISLNYLTILFLIIKEEFKDILSLTDDLVREEKLKETITRHSKLLE
ncbi:unnamed protein product [Leptosia nina]|uniref:Uncharacterized protein n=1 Tax=Leptosia nina TaxID=320188 RepID=A0AAV1IUE0_9NEOP